MSLHRDLLRQARQLATRERRRPLQASLRRAVSASYYAVFHLLVYEAMSRLVTPTDRVNLRHCLGRAFGHADMKTVVQQFANNNVSPKLSPGLNTRPLQTEIVRLAAAFVDLQQRGLTRHFTGFTISQCGR